MNANEFTSALQVILYLFVQAENLCGIIDFKRRKQFQKHPLKPLVLHSIVVVLITADWFSSYLGVAREKKRSDRAMLS